MNIHVFETPLLGLKVVRGDVFHDERGTFSRRFCSSIFTSLDLPSSWKQINLSTNLKRGTFRGFHYQVEPYQEIKLVQCVQGRILDIAVDVRTYSRTYLKSFMIELDSLSNISLLIPQGFAHGFQTLEHNSSVLYFSTEQHMPQYEHGLRFSDPVLDIQLPHVVTSISKKDESWPLL